MSVDIRKISNGYLVSHSRSTPKGYERTEVYHPEMPDMRSIGIEPPKTRSPRDT